MLMKWRNYDCTTRHQFLAKRSAKRLRPVHDRGCRAPWLTEAVIDARVNWGYMCMKTDPPAVDHLFHRSDYPLIRAVVPP